MDAIDPDDTHGPLFELGEVVISENAQSVLDEQMVAKAVALHSNGQWGYADRAKCRLNDRSIAGDKPLVSEYIVAHGVRVLVTTNGQRTRTLVDVYGSQVQALLSSQSSK